MSESKYHFISLNLLKKSHKDLLKWIKWSAEDQEMSISSFCIGLIKKEYEAQKEKGTWKTDME